MERYIIVDTLKAHPMELKNYPEYQDDDELVRIAVKKKGMALQFASARLRDDYETVMLAVKKDGIALQFASARLRDDYELVILAIKENGNALEFASKNLQNNRNILLEASKRCKAELIPEEFLGDVEIVENLLGNSCDAFQYLPDEMRSDVDLIVDILERDGDILIFVPEEVFSDKDAVLKIVGTRAYAYEYISDSLKDDREIALAAMKAYGSPWAYENLPKALKSDIEILCTFVDNIQIDYSEEFEFIYRFNGSYIPDELLEDDEFILKIGSIYECAQDTLEIDKKLAMRLIEVSAIDFELLSDELLEDEDIQELLEGF